MADFVAQLLERKRGLVVDVGGLSGTIAGPDVRVRRYNCEDANCEDCPNVASFQQDPIDAVPDFATKTGLIMLDLGAVRDPALFFDALLVHAFRGTLVGRDRQAQGVACGDRFRIGVFQRV